MQSVGSLFVADDALESTGAMASHFRHSHSNSSGSAGYMLLPTQSAPLDGHTARRAFGLDLGLECAAQQTVLQIQNTDLVCCVGLFYANLCLLLLSVRHPFFAKAILCLLAAAVSSALLLPLNPVLR